MDFLNTYGHLDCFTSFKSNLERVVKFYYFGLACKLRGEGELLPKWFDLIDKVIDYGKIALVEYGGNILLARINNGFKNRNGGWTDLKLCFFGDEDEEEFTPASNNYVIFQWGSGEPFSLERFNHEILEMWHLKSLIGWDQDKSKKRMMIEFERDPGKDGWKNPLNSYESGFIGIVAPQKSTNQIKKWEYFVPRNTDERQQLWKDLREVESRFFLQLGIRHNPFAKEERQNNPEVMSGQAFFDAWEIQHQEGTIQGILDFQGKRWGGGKYTLQFGSLPTLLIENQTTQPILAQTSLNEPTQPLLNKKASENIYPERTNAVLMAKIDELTSMIKNNKYNDKN